MMQKDKISLESSSICLNVVRASCMCVQNRGKTRHEIQVLGLLTIRACQYLLYHTKRIVPITVVARFKT
jgi:hypothetical protein